MGTLATELAVSPSASTALIDKLVSKDLVRRTVSAEDRRMVMIELTERGKIDTRISGATGCAWQRQCCPPESQRRRAIAQAHGQNTG